MKTRHLLPIGAALLALAGCTDQPSAPVVAAPGSTAPSAIAATTGADVDTKAAYLESLGDIDRTLVENELAAVDSGENICLDIKQRKPVDQLTRNAAARFDVNTAQASQIIAVTRAKLCRAL
jgi:hypothetical protein